METKKKAYRENHPGYMGYIPYKKDIVGLTIGATNEKILNTLSYEPPSEEYLIPNTKDDYSVYNKDYYTQDFARNYDLEEHKINSNNSIGAKTWIGGSKFEIYPQHIPGMLY